MKKSFFVFLLISTYTAYAQTETLEELQVSDPATKNTATSTQVKIAYDIRLRFPSGYDTLSSSMERQLAQINIEPRAIYRFWFQGEDDEMGSESYTFDLRSHRAQAIKDFLVSQKNLDPKHIQIVDYKKLGSSIEETSTIASPRPETNVIIILPP
ncbi:MAG: hypothetical protein K0S08_1687 [Gammaproteobacteria bacterium]|jgi:outer membrane protein OmpA-like peptidoglycan-associated protein|nr:hypothetical protein [Gammaproteobacteria bacterium]